MKNYRIFDTHVHIFPDKIAHKAVDHLADYYHVIMAAEGTWDSLDASLAEAVQIEKCLIHSTATRPEQVRAVNDFVSSKISDRFLGFGSIHADYDDIEGEIERIISLGLRGIKLHTDFQGFKADSDKAFRIYECAEGRLPILFHVGDEYDDLSNPKRIRRIHDNFPNLTIIAAHLGGSFMNMAEAEEYLVGQNVYFDTCSSLEFIDPAEAKRIILAHGTDKCLFGTDFPMHNQKATIENILKLGLSDEDNQKIFWDNAAKLFGL